METEEQKRFSREGWMHMNPSGQTETTDLIARSPERDRHMDKSCIYDDMDKGIVISLQIAFFERE